MNKDLLGWLGIVLFMATMFGAGMYFRDPVVAAEPSIKKGGCACLSAGDDLG